LNKKWSGGVTRLEKISLGYRTITSRKKPLQISFIYKVNRK